MTDEERVQCNRCREWFWKSECRYFDYGDDGEGHDIKGHECEECTKANKEIIAASYQRLLRMCEEYKTNPPIKQQPLTFDV